MSRLDPPFTDCAAYRSRADDCDLHEGRYRIKLVAIPAARSFGAALAETFREVRKEVEEALRKSAPPKLADHNRHAEPGDAISTTMSVVEIKPSGGPSGKSGSRTMRRWISFVSIRSTASVNLASGKIVTAGLM
jgi:hypothetical protein